MSVPRRDAILEAAAALFAHRGYHGTTMTEIGRAADITAPALYRHFPSKMAILLELIERAAEDFFERADAIVSGEPDPARMIEQLARLNVALILDQEVLTAAYWLEGAEILGAESLRRSTARYLELWTGALARVRPDLGADEIEVLAQGVFWLMRSTSFYSGELPRARLADLLTTFTLNAVRP